MRGRNGEKPGPAGKRLGQAGGDEMHAVRQAQLGAQPRALRAVGAQRMRLIHQDGAAMLLDHLDDLGQRAQRARGAVHRIDHHDARARGGQSCAPGAPGHCGETDRLARAQHARPPTRRYGPGCQDRQGSAHRQSPAAARHWPNSPTGRQNRLPCRPRPPGRPPACGTDGHRAKRRPTGSRSSLLCCRLAIWARTMSGWPEMPR